MVVIDYVLLLAFLVFFVVSVCCSRCCSLFLFFCGLFVVSSWFVSFAFVHMYNVWLHDVGPCGPSTYQLDANAL